MSATRERRLPISCEPCRIRKIRCTRDSTPCGTCQRRGIPVSKCVYAKRHTSTAAVSVLPPQSLPISPLSEGNYADSPPNEDLATRVSRLEGMLSAQNTFHPQLNTPSSSYSDQNQWQRSTEIGPGSINCNLSATSEESTRPRGTLQTSNSGHVKFIPSSSRWSAGLGSSGLDTNGASVDCSDGPFPLGESDNKTLAVLLAELPPAGLCARLKDVYFHSFAPLFHVLHDPTFNQQYTLFENDPDSMPWPWIALLFAVLGTAVTALDFNSDILSELSRKPTITGKIADLSCRYRSAAIKCLEADNYLWQHNIITLQALIVLIYGMNHSHGQTWTLLGLTHHLALAIGCHVDPSNFGLDVVECEERRRCWAGLMMLYMIQNTSMGNLGPQYHRSHCTTKMPADLNDSDLIAGQHAISPSYERATQMSYLLLKFRLYEISSSICTQVLSTSHPSAVIISNLDQIILKEHAYWERSYYFHSRTEPLPVYHTVHLNILYGYSYQLALLLHRPILTNPASDPVQQGISWARCTESAKALLGIHALFYNCQEFAPFGWYLRGLASFHAFHAAVVIVAMLAKDITLPNSTELGQLVEQCTERFEALSDLSLICRKAAPVLRHLLSGVEPKSPMVVQTYPIEVRSDQSSHDYEATPTTTSNESIQMPQSGYSGTSGMANLDFIFDQLEPQRWMNPAAISWDQWDSMMVNPPNFDHIGSLRTA